jgi:hypothetical protein
MSHLLSFSRASRRSFFSPHAPRHLRTIIECLDTARDLGCPPCRLHGAIHVDSFRAIYILWNHICLLYLFRCKFCILLMKINFS